MYSRRGYLMVAEKESTAAQFDTALATHARHGVRSRRVTTRELARIAPALAVQRVREAIYLPDSGVCPHHAAMEAYSRKVLEDALERNGWNQTRAAEELELQRTYFTKLLRQKQIPGHPGQK